jgi:transposase
LQPLASIRVPVSREGYRALRRFARRWADIARAVEGASGVGALLTRRLRADNIEVIDVPAKLATRVRVLSIGQGRKKRRRRCVRAPIRRLQDRPPSMGVSAADYRLDQSVHWWRQCG